MDSKHFELIIDFTLHTSQYLTAELFPFSNVVVGVSSLFFFKRHNVDGKVQFFNPVHVSCHLIINVQHAVYDGCPKAFLSPCRLLYMWERVHVCVFQWMVAIFGHFFLSFCCDALSSLLRVFIHWFSDGDRCREMFQTYSLLYTLQSTHDSLQDWLQDLKKMSWQRPQCLLKLLDQPLSAVYSIHTNEDGRCFFFYWNYFSFFLTFSGSGVIIAAFLYLTFL